MVYCFSTATRSLQIEQIVLMLKLSGKINKYFSVEAGLNLRASMSSFLFSLGNDIFYTCFCTPLTPQPLPLQVEKNALHSGWSVAGKRSVAFTVCAIVGISEWMSVGTVKQFSPFPFAFLKPPAAGPKCFRPPPESLASVPVLLYGSETWILSAAQPPADLDAFQVLVLCQLDCSMYSPRNDHTTERVISAVKCLCPHLSALIIILYYN